MFSSSLLVTQLTPNQKCCPVCSKVFVRKCNFKLWSVQKTCSIACRNQRMKNKDKIRNGKALRFGIRRFTCCLCNEEILGNKEDLKRHKYERHSH